MQEVEAVDKVTKIDSIPLFRAEYMVPFIERLKDFENNIYPIIEQAKLPESILTAEHEFVTEQSVLNLLKIVSNRLGGKRYAEWLLQITRTIFIPQYLAKFSLNCSVKKAIKELVKVVNFESKHTDIQLKTALGKVWFARYRHKEDPEEHDLAEQFAMTVMVAFIRAITHSKWCPVDIALQSQNVNSYLSVLGSDNAQIFTGRRVTAISISDEVLRQTIKVKQGWQSMKKAVGKSPDSFAESLRYALSPYLSMGRLPITTAADLLGLSVRTLQRRLAEENVSYTNMVEDIWFKQAIGLLVDENLAVTQVSATLGYADVAHFSRAFKRKAGLSPRAYKNSLS
ncbi:helix-turn-helix domain-containing protein [Shewanella donghaensis]|uniref:helix-turn-helix domain-containing protein n=1 Tax=Shewanella donghaensis TaxID=238836 RepID=UPI0011820CC5|nr:helix-turn-helix domain-containing protein [Shewanella donghaensis]